MSVAELDAAVSVCRACPRLVDWREEIAPVKRKSFAAQPYWGRPVPGWGSEQPRVLIVGLAPAAHGGNRTGRVFTGDRSGDVLFAALHRAGLANQALAVDAADGLAAHRHPRRRGRALCAAGERADAGRAADLRAVAGRRVATGRPAREGDRRAGRLRVAGGVADGARRVAAPRFGHGAEATVGAGVLLLGCYHPSQQNTFTGKLTPAMLDDVFTRARIAAGIPGTDGR